MENLKIVMNTVVPCFKVTWYVEIRKFKAEYLIGQENDQIVQLSHFSGGEIGVQQS